MRTGVPIKLNWFCSSVKRVVCAGVGAALLALVMSMSATAEPKRLLLLHSIGASSWELYAQLIREELARQYREPLDVYEASLVQMNFVEPSADARFGDYLHAILGNHRPDLIISIGGPAVAFSQRYRDQLFSSTPMVLTGVDQMRIATAHLAANDIVFAYSADNAGLMKKFLGVLPETNRVLVVTGTSPNQKFYTELLRKEFEPFAPRISFSLFDESSPDSLVKEAATLPARSLIYWGKSLYSNTEDVKRTVGKEFSSLYSIANAPIFSFNCTYFGNGIAGCPNINNSGVIGQLASSAVVRILHGDAVGDIKTLVGAKPVSFDWPLSFDWREMQRWGIGEGRLPPGSEIQFRPLTAWDQYRWQIVLITAALLTQMLLISGLFYERRRRFCAETTSRQRMSELAHMNRSATAGELSASIAHEIKQPLQAITANGSAGLHFLAAGTPDLAEAREAFQDIVDQAHRANGILGTIRSMFMKVDQEKVALNINVVIEKVLTLLRTDFLRRRFWRKLGLVRASL